MANFLLKICIMGVCVQFYFAAIRYYHSHSIIAFFCLAVAAECNCFFVLMFDKAFQVQGKVEALCLELKVMAARLWLRSDREDMRTRINSLKVQGIQVGGFRTFERDSTPVFLDFVFNQVVSLLVMEV